jgi:hypothetical protein
MAARRPLPKNFSLFIPGFPTTPTAFKEAYIASDLIDSDEWAGWYGRIARFSLLWAFFEGNAYSDHRTWARDYKKVSGVYAWARQVVNMAYRLGDFYRTHIFGGRLPEAIPIVKSENRDLNPAISPAIHDYLYRHSNWQVQKDIVGLWGPVLGEVGIRVVDNPTKQRVYLEPVSPATVTQMTPDMAGNVQSYTRHQARRDPEEEYEWVRFSEECWKDGDTVYFQTYRNEQPYEWPDQPESDDGEGHWSVDYGFVPMVWIKHFDPGLEGGWAEFTPAIGGVREVDDLCSILTDQARRILNSPWLMNSKKPTSSLMAGPTQTPNEMAATESTYEPIGRDRLRLYWNDPANNGGKNAQPFQLAGDMPLGDVGDQIDRLTRFVEKMYPELLIDGETTGDSGRARRSFRQRAESKVEDRRAAYEDALVRAHQMALSIGGSRPGRRAYPGYEAFDESSYDSFELAHRIGIRPIFAKDPLDLLEVETARATSVRTSKEAGIKTSIAMRRSGYTEEEIAEQEVYEAENKAIAASISNLDPTPESPEAQESIDPSNRGANPPTDMDSPSFDRGFVDTAMATT